MLLAGPGVKPQQAAIPEGGIDPPHYSQRPAPSGPNEGLSGRKQKVRPPGLDWTSFSSPLPWGRTGPGPAICRNLTVRAGQGLR